jgi:hypothetical protein
MKNDYLRDVVRPSESFKLPPPPPPPPPPPSPTLDELYKALQDKVAADIAKSKAEGLAESIRTFENADSDQAKDILMQHWKDGKTQLVLDIFNGMDDKRKDKIIAAFRTTNDEELKVINEIMQKIAAGEPKTSMIQKAAEDTTQG